MNFKTNESSERMKNVVSDSIENASIIPTPFLLPLMKKKLFENQLGFFEILLEDTEFNAKEIICNIQPLRIYIEDKFIAVLLDFAIENLPSNIIYIPDANECVECEAGEILIPKLVTEQILSFLSEPLRLNRICIKPLSVLLSLHTCIRYDTRRETTQINEFNSMNIIFVFCVFTECILLWIIARYTSLNSKTKISTQQLWNLDIILECIMFMMP